METFMCFVLKKVIFGTSFGLRFDGQTRLRLLCES